MFNVIIRKQDMGFFFQGLMMGLAYVAPIGMQNIFVINSAASERLPRAIITALIVIFFDVTLAFACFYGAGLAIERYGWLRLLVSFIGSLVLLFTGIKLVLSSEVGTEGHGAAGSVPRTICTACAVTWFNPQAIIDGSLMLGAFRASMQPAEAFHFIIGAGCASCLWFLGLTVSVSVFSRILTPRLMRGINIICGSIIIFFGLRLFLAAVIGAGSSS